MRFLVYSLFVLSLLLISTGGVALAQDNPFYISFPIAELGNCASMEQCKLHCDNPNNLYTCIAWADNQGIATDHQKREDVVGPGGCDSHQSCDQYCHNPDNNQECLDFAVRKGHLTSDEADRLLELQQKAEQFRDISREGPGPFEPDIHKPDEPDIDHQRAEQIIDQLGAGPGGCEDFDACDEFCSTPGNEATCLDFAVLHGLIPADQAEELRRMLIIEGPGGCKGRACEDYCDSPLHEQECLEFAREQGFIQQEEYNRAKRFEEFHPGENFGEFEGQFNQEVDRQFQRQFEQQFNQEFQHQFEQQFDQEYDRPPSPPSIYDFKELDSFIKPVTPDVKYDYPNRPPEIPHLEIPDVEIKASDLGATILAPFVRLFQ